jgi:AraC-like DNA-binding protein
MTLMAPPDYVPQQRHTGPVGQWVRRSGASESRPKRDRYRAAARAGRASAASRARGRRCFIPARPVCCAPALRPFVECLWVHHIPHATPDEDRRILPDGRMDLIWISGLGLVVAGPKSRFTTRPRAAPMLAVGARFHPGAAPLLLRSPAVAFRDDHVPLDAVDARLARRLGAALERASDQTTALASLDRELRRLLDDLQPDPVFRAAVALLGSGHEDGELARAASTAGYADQAHLTHESRRLTGLTPRQLARWADRR